MNKKNIAIFASGGGSNALALMRYFNNHATIQVALVVSNNPSAGVFQKAADEGVPAILLSKNEMQATEKVLGILQDKQIDFIVLAGYLLLIPAYLVDHFPNKIINIHPALLPKYGGKGMHGMHVHEAVFAAKEPESGITIHFVNNEYDKGAVIFQAKVALTETDTAPMIAEKVLALEHYYLPRVVEKVLLSQPVIF
jgi:phosphoribosylglycinamide formyltransferase-1